MRKLQDIVLFMDETSAFGASPNPKFMRKRALPVANAPYSTVQKFLPGEFIHALKALCEEIGIQWLVLLTRLRFYNFIIHLVRV